MAADTIGFYVSSNDLTPGSIIEPGQWGSVIAHYGSMHVRYEVETRFENVRASEYSTKPSRLTSNFLWARLEDAEWYKRAVHPADTIYEVVWDQELGFHQGCMLLLDEQQGMTTDQRARHYWAFDHGISIADPPYVPIEIVTASPMHIVRALNQP